MNAAQFLELIQKGDSLNGDEILQMQKMQRNFPYFQIPYVLIARYEYLNSGTVESAHLGYAAITSPDRVWLKSYIEKSENKPLSTSEVTFEAEIKVEESTSTNPEAQEVEIGSEPVKSKPRKRKPPKDDLIEMIKQKEKKIILDEKKKEQINLIKEFSKKSIKMATLKEIEANKNTENLAAASTQMNDRLISESYAMILAKQGKKQLAMEIYEKLILKFPDKRTYFADLIEKLKA